MENVKTAYCVESFKRVKEHVESIKNDEHAFVGSMSEGDAYAQGDVLIVRLSDKLNLSELIVASRQDPKIAPGKTQGSRHIIGSMDGITIYTKPNATALEGPVIVAQQAFRLTHPEHGDRTFESGIYAAFYQRAYADELRRVQD